MSELALPHEWEEAPLVDCLDKYSVISDGDWVETKDQDVDGSVRLIQLADIGDGFFRDKSNRFMNTEDASRLNCTYLKEGDVLVARMPDPLGRACIFPKLNQEAVTVVDVCLIRPSDESALSSNLLKFWINSPIIRNKVAMDATGTTRKRITRKKLEKFDFPVPPLLEQEQIIKLLNTHLTTVSQIQARLGAIPKLIEKFCQSVLSDAVSGRLTGEWRHNNGEDEWKIVELNTIMHDGMQNGLYKPKNYYGRGVKIVRIDSFYDGKVVEWDKIKRVELEDDEKQKWQLRVNDILINRVNSIEYLGKCARVVDLPEDAVFESNIMRFSAVTTKINPKYLIVYLTSIQGISELRKNAKLAVNQASINQQDVGSVICPLPSLNEQAEIVKQVNKLFAHADQIEKSVATAKARVDHLTQSILHQAFTGNLTAEWREQNPELISGENSAEALLAKIKAEKQVSVKKGKVKK